MSTYAEKLKELTDGDPVLKLTLEAYPEFGKLVENAVTMADRCHELADMWLAASRAAIELHSPEAPISEPEPEPQPINDYVN